MYSVIKAGQTITTYHKSWLAIFAKLIKFATGEKRDHALKILQVVNEGDCDIMVFETRLLTGATIKNYSRAALYKRLSKAKVYVGNPVINPSEEKLDVAIDYAINRNNDAYGFWNMMREAWFIDKLFSFMGIKRNDQAFCSVLCAEVDAALFKNGNKILEVTDGYPSPLEYEKITNELGIMTWEEVKDLKGFIGI